MNQILPLESLYDDNPAAEEETQSFVTFRLGSEWYGVSVKDVREIVRMPLIVTLPSLPFSILGIANVRGDLLPVIDPKRILELPALDPSVHSRLIVLTSNGMEAGLLADEVAEMIPAPVSHLEPPLATLNANLLSYVESVCKWQDRLIAIFRVSTLLDFKERRTVCQK